MEYNIALCFWGLTRSLKYTIDSINSNILNILKEKNIKYKIYLHSYKVNEIYNNPRANEYNLILDNEEYKLLNADYILIDNQEEIKKKLDLNKYRTHKDPWNTNYKTMDNFIVAMYSKKRLWELIKSKNEIHTHYLFLRPDVKYLNKFNLQWFNDIKLNEIYVPCFHYNYFKFNDRMALIKNKKIALIYSNLFNNMYEYSKKKELHSETFNKELLEKFFLKSINLKIIPIEIFFNRIRANGKEQHDIIIKNNNYIYK